MHLYQLPLLTLDNIECWPIPPQQVSVVQHNHNCTATVTVAVLVFTIALDCLIACNLYRLVFSSCLKLYFNFENVSSFAWQLVTCLVDVFWGYRWGWTYGNLKGRWKQCVARRVNIDAADGLFSPACYLWPIGYDVAPPAAIEMNSWKIL